jgi:hypothetical protein
VVNVTGNVTGGGAGNLCHGINYSVGSLAVTGNVTGGTQIYSYGINAAASLSVVITGDIIPSATTPAIGLVGTGSGTTTILHTGNIQASSAGIAPFGGSHKYLLHATNALQHSYYTNASGVPGVSRSLYTGGVNLNQPATANVRSGTVFGASSEYTGTLAVPSPTLVAIGVATDNTVGSYAPTGGLDAAGVRTAIGLASANLDTQLSGLATQTSVDALGGSSAVTVERSISDTKAITFAWPVSGATITGTRSIDNGTYGAVTGAITFLRTETGKHYYTLAYNAADRPSVEGQVRYKFIDGTYTRYVVLRTVTTALDSADKAALVDLIWDEPLTGATHNVATSSGKRLRQTTAFQQIDSTVIDAAATATTFATGLDSAVDDFYNDSMLVFTDGALAGQVRAIYDYVGATKTIVLEEALTSAPVNGVAFSIVSLHIHPVSQIQSGLATAASIVTLRGADSDTLKTLSDQIDTVSTNVSSIASVSREAF